MDQKLEITHPQAKNSELPPYKMSGEDYPDRFAAIYHALTEDWNIYHLLQKLEDKAKLREPINLLDIGIGDGAFFLEAIKSYPDIKYHGIDTQEYNPNLIKQGVNFTQGDAQDITTIYPEKKFRLALASNIAQWLKDPVDTLLKQGHEILDKEGILLINMFPLNKVIANPEHIPQFIEYMEKEFGWAFNSRPEGFYDIAVRRSPQPLILPLQKTGETKVLRKSIGREPSIDHRYAVYTIDFPLKTSK